MSANRVYQRDTPPLEYLDPTSTTLDYVLYVCGLVCAVYLALDYLSSLVYLDAPDKMHPIKQSINALRCAFCAMPPTLRLASDKRSYCAFLPPQYTQLAIEPVVFFRYVAPLASPADH